MAPTQGLYCRGILTLNQNRHSNEVRRRFVQDQLLWYQIKLVPGFVAYIFPVLEQGGQEFRGDSLDAQLASNAEAWQSATPASVLYCLGR